MTDTTTDTMTDTMTDTNSNLSGRFSARFFFCVPGTEGTPCGTIPVENFLGEVEIDNADDDKLRREVRRLIMAKDSHIEMAKTHTVVADVGISKSCGGLGASHPHETVILFRPV